MDHKRPALLKGFLPALQGCPVLPSTFLGLLVILFLCKAFRRGAGGYEIANAFNNMGAPLLAGKTFIFGVLILLVGHVFNFVLCYLGVLVHGIRLKTLEFSGRLGMQWSGHEYSPFNVRRDIAYSADISAKTKTRKVSTSGGLSETWLIKHNNEKERASMIEQGLLGLMGIGGALGLSALGTGLGVGAAGQAVVGAWKRAYMQNKTANFMLLAFAGFPLSQTFYGLILMNTIVASIGALDSGAVLGMSAWMQGVAGAGAADAYAETGKGFVNYIMVIGVIESVALLVMVFLMTTIGTLTA